MVASLRDIFDIVNTAIDLAFSQEKYQLKFLDYLKGENFKRDDIISFIESSLFVSIQDQIVELDLYLDGGENSASFKEAYSWMGKPRARKIREYLQQIIDDAEQYEQSKRRGRKPATKNKKKTTTANK